MDERGKQRKRGWEKTPRPFSQQPPTSPTPAPHPSQKVAQLYGNQCLFAPGQPSVVLVEVADVGVLIIQTGK